MIFLTAFSAVFFTVFGQGKFETKNCRTLNAFSSNSKFSEWQVPYFLHPGTEGVYFDEFVATSQRIRMLEELPIPIKLAIINYSGKTEKITKFHETKTKLTKFV